MRNVLVFADGRVRYDEPAALGDVVLIAECVPGAPAIRRFERVAVAHNASTRRDGLLVEGGDEADANDGCVVYAEFPPVGDVSVRLRV